MSSPSAPPDPAGGSSNWTNLTTFEDSATVCVAYDPVLPEEYGRDYRDGRAPIVIDNGSWECRAGYASDADPRLRFRSVVARPRVKREGAYGLVGHQIPSLDVYRLRTRSPFEGNLVVNFDMQELLLDYVFLGLGLGGQAAVDHPVLMTEALCNPNYCRARMNEMLFEGYGVPAVAYGVDCLFSLDYNLAEGSLADVGAGCGDALVVSSAYETTHVVPVVGGRPAFDQSARLQVGGDTAQALLHRTLQMRYPQHAQELTAARAEEMVRRFCDVAPEDYMEELRATERAMVAEEHAAHGKGDESASVAGAIEPVVVQLPYSEADGPGGKQLTAEEEKSRAERRAANAERLRAMAAQRRKEKLEELRRQSAEFEALVARREAGEIGDEEWEAMLERGNFDDEDDFRRTLKDIRRKYAEARRKQDSMGEGSGAEDGDGDGDGGGAPKTDAELYPLLDVPDEQLDEEQLKAKRHQRMMKGGAEARARRREEQERERARAEAARAAEEARAREDGPAFLAELRQRREEVRRRQARREQARQSQGSDRRSKQARQRMRMLATMGHTNGEDSFGQDDSHWDIYREAAGEQSDSEHDREEVEEVEQKMAAYFPEELERERGPELTRAEMHQVTLRVDRRRVPETLFQPSICGVEQAGVAEIVGRCLARMEADAASRAARTVLVTGGNTSFASMRARVENELRAIRPYGEPLRVERASDPVLDAWRGARLFANARARDETVWVTRKEYEEMGPDYLKEHGRSNAYVPTPDETEEGKRRRKRRR